jgi:hypothetical protein
MTHPSDVYLGALILLINWIEKMEIEIGNKIENIYLDWTQFDWKMKKLLIHLWVGKVGQTSKDNWKWEEKCYQMI